LRSPPAREFGEHCKFTQRGSGQSPYCQKISVFFTLKMISPETKRQMNKRNESAQINLSMNPLCLKTKQLGIYTTSRYSLPDCRSLCMLFAGATLWHAPAPLQQCIHTNWMLLFLKQLFRLISFLSCCHIC